MGEWTDWTTCTATCGGGTQTHTRTPMTPASCGGTACPVSSESRSCGTNCCRVDCVMGEWTDWTTCTATCGGGTQTHTRTPMTAASCGGTACPASSESRSCNTNCCRVDCVMDDWSVWTTCTATCGGGTQTHTRTPLTPASCGGTTCPASSESRSCNTDPCPVDCVVSNWGNWTTCSKTCGNGTQTRTRTIVSPAQFGGSCVSTSETQSCNTQCCRVDCVMGEWTSFGPCSATCGGGQKVRTRMPLTAASCNGTPCGSTQDSQQCNPAPCR